jgi:hypothetical protein
MPWWQEIIFWVLAFVAYMVLLAWLPEGLATGKVLLLPILGGVAAWLIRKRR